MEEKKYKILIVDDETDIIEFLTYNLLKEGYEVYSSSNGKDAIKQALKINPHLILLDIMMPEMDGIETCEIIRKTPSLENVLIAFLTARNEDYSQIAGFDAGADDYVAKPIKNKVLLSRIKALLKRYEKSNIVIEKDFEGLHIDKERFIVINNGIEISLPKKEFELLSLLYSKPDRVFTREEIYDIIWGDNVIVSDRTIDVHIRKLRERIGEEHIITIKGVGYKFVR